MRRIQSEVRGAQEGRSWTESDCIWVVRRACCVWNIMEAEIIRPYHMRNGGGGGLAVGSGEHYGERSRG